MFGLPGFLFTWVLKLTLTSCHLRLLLSGVSSLLMIRIIVAVMNALIKRKFCHTGFVRQAWNFTVRDVGTSEREVRRGTCETTKKAAFRMRGRVLKVPTIFCWRLLFRAFPYRQREEYPLVFWMDVSRLHFVGPRVDPASFSQTRALRTSCLPHVPSDM